jgi:hypothetical protein
VWRFATPRLIPDDDHITANVPSNGGQFRRDNYRDVSMNANISTTSQSTSGIAVFRRWLLRIHGTILTLVALGSAVATTIGWMTGAGLFGFMQQNPMVWVGLIQAYLLMTIVAVLLVLGSGQADARKWKPFLHWTYSSQWGLSGLFEWPLRSTLSGSVLKQLLHFIRTRATYGLPD